MKTFLRTQWLNLLNITYAVDPSVLMPYLPKGLQLDCIDGKAFVSIVAFEFRNTFIKGIRFPFHSDFPEINLRFYVHNKGKRGVVFIREFVSRFFVGTIANLAYNEHFSIVPVSVKREKSDDEIRLTYKMKIRDEWFELSATAGNKSFLPKENSPEYYFEEQHYGFGSDRKGNTFGFVVEHPAWEVYPLKDYRIDFDFGKIYGKTWAFLNTATPYNAMLVKGSDVLLYEKAPVLAD